MVKGKKKGNTKPPSPCRQNRMLCSLNHRQDITVCKNTKLKSPLVPFEELIMDKGDLSKKSEYDNCYNINFQLHHALNQVYLNTDLLDGAILTKVVLRPTKKTKECRPTQINIKGKCQQKEITPRKQEIQGCE